MSYQLENLAQMDNYYGWILNEFSPCIGRRIMEIGAGSGTFSRMILAHGNVEHLWLVEPDNSLARGLAERFAGVTNVTVLNLAAEELTTESLAALALDTIVMVNVLEHIAEDVALLRKCAGALCPGGRVLTFSPAFPLLYSDYDKLVGHFRRYTKQEIAEKLVAVNFRVHTVKYFNFVGFFAWLLLVRLLKFDTFGETRLNMYEKMIWLLQFMEQRLQPPIGQSVIAIGVKQP